MNIKKKNILPTIAVMSFLTTPVSADDLPYKSTIVADVRTAAILSASNIDTPIQPQLMGRMSLITLGIDHLSRNPDAMNQTLADISETSVINALSILADNPEDHLDIHAFLAKYLVDNSKLFKQKFLNLKSKISLQATKLSISVSENGTPVYKGYTTLRDLARITISLVRAHNDFVKDIFDNATGGEPQVAIWIAEESECILVGQAPNSDRILLSAVSHLADTQTCYETAASNLMNQDLRIFKSLK